DLCRVTVRNFDGPEISVIVLQQNLTSVQRPLWRRKECRRWQRHRFWCCKSQRIAEHKLVLSTSIREPCEARAIWRPGWTAIIRAGTLRQVSIIAFLCGHCEDVTAGFEGRANSGGRQCRIANHTGNFFELRPRPGEISGYFDVQSLRFAGCRIDEIDVSGLFV